MSAKDQMRAMLDELMGTTRNGETSRNALRFDDYRVCKAFLLGCCPSDILAQTRADIRSCNKVHDLALKADYEKEAARGSKSYNFEYDALDILESFINDCERKKEIAKRKLKETQDKISDEVAKKLERVNEAEAAYNAKLLEVEEHGSKGEVDESIKAIAEAEELKKKKFELEQDYKNATSPFAYQQQKLRICDICMAHLGINDNDKRLVDHFGGKLHSGFIQIREKLDELRKKVDEMRSSKRKSEENSRNSSSSKHGSGDVSGNSSTSSRRDRGGSEKDHRSSGGDRHGSDHRSSRSSHHHNNHHNKKKSRSRSRSRSRSSRSGSNHRRHKRRSRS